MARVRRAASWSVASESQPRVPKMVAGKAARRVARANAAQRLGQRAGNGVTGLRSSCTIDWMRARMGRRRRARELARRPS